MRATYKIILPVGMAMFLGACATQVTPPPAPQAAAEIAETAKGGIRHQALTVAATVEKVDTKNRRVDLVLFDGTRESVVVGDDVRNLDQVSKGDEVVVTFYESVAFEVLEPGEEKPAEGVSGGVARAKLGEMPGGLAARTVTLVAHVLKLDPEKMTATLRDSAGEIVTVDIYNPAVFDKVTVGDDVQIELTEAFAIDVQKKPKR